MGTRVHALLLNHMQQFTYSAPGALRWKGDVGSYADQLLAWGVPSLKQLVEGLQVGGALGRPRRA
jgi:hypothetical protein